MTTNYLSRPKMVKTFAINAMNANHLAVRFGTNRLAKDVESIANDNFEYGIESLEGDLQPRDLNSVLKYLSANLTYLFQQGVAEFSPYQDYPLGALAQHDGSLWITTKEIKASKHEPKFDPCNPCAFSKDCEVTTFPSEENGWCRLVTYCEYKKDLNKLHEKDEAIEAAVADLKGVQGFSILPNADTGFLELNLALSNGKSVVIPMTKFGHIEQNKDGTLSITNANGTTLELPKYVAEKDLNQQKGFFFNAQSGKWEIDLADLLQERSGIEVDRNGKFKVKVDNKSLSKDKDGNVEINPDWVEKNIKPLKDYQDLTIDKSKQDLENAIRNLNQQQQALKDAEEALRRAKDSGKYLPVKEAQENLDRIKAQIEANKTGISDLYARMKGLGMSPAEFEKLLENVLNNSRNGSKSLQRIEVLPNGKIKYHYADGTSDEVSPNAVNHDSSLKGNGINEPLGVRISSKKGNGITVLPDGLFLGTNSLYPELYVDAVNGADDNIGSRRFPLRTVKEALYRNTSGANMNVRVYLHSNQDHVISNATTENSLIDIIGSTIRFLPYGDDYDALMREPYAVDGYQRNKYMNHMQQIPPRLVFKDMLRYTGFPYNSTSDKQMFIHDIRRLHFRNCNVTFEGITFIADLNTIKFNVKGLGQSGTYNEHGDKTIISDACFISNEGSNFTLVHCTFKTIGAVEVIGTPEEVRTYNNLPSSLSTKRYLFRKIDNRTVCTIGFFNVQQEENQSNSFREIANIKRYDLNCYIFGSTGWGVQATANKQFAMRYTGTSVNATYYDGEANRSNTSVDDLLKYIHPDNLYLDEETKSVLAPFVDVSYTKFKAGLAKQSFID